MISFSLKKVQPPAVPIGRLFVAAAGASPLAAAIYRAPAWLENWHGAAVAAALAAAATLLVLALAVAIHGNASAVRRVAVEIAFLGCSLIGAEAILLAASPETWSSDALVQRTIARERSALAQGIEYDGRDRSEVVAALRSEGVDAVAGFAQGVGTGPQIAAAIRERGVLPLTNPSNAYIVECNEGPGYLEFRSDEHGFNNPPGLTQGPVDVAVIGASFALGHCVAPSMSAVELLRERYPRTANFGVAGSRVLSQLGVFREYVASLEPPIVVWFINSNFAEPRQEASQPVLLKYLDDPSYSQKLRLKQSKVDAFLRELVIPLNAQHDAEVRQKMEAARRFPLERVVKLSEIRNLVDFGPAVQRPLQAPDLSHFDRAIGLVADAVHGWGGRLVVVIVPRYEISTDELRSVTQYEAVRGALDAAGVSVVDGVALFEQQQDLLGLYTMRTNNHPSEQGHAVIAGAVVAAVEAEEIL
jgi:hypothetical protein